MAISLHQKIRVGAYVVGQHLRGVRRYPLVLMLEPLFRCNLACAGCGKIDYPDAILNQRLSVAECLEAVDECGAPIVVIAGGEPLLHREIEQIVEGIIARKKFVYLCTNALLLEKKIDLFKPNPYFAWTVHLDGDRDDHDRSVCQNGVYDRAVEAIEAGEVARLPGQHQRDAVRQCRSGADGAVLRRGHRSGHRRHHVSPGYAYERAPDQEHFLNRRRTKELFRDIFRRDPKRRWSFNQSSLFLDFLAGNQIVSLHAVGQPDAQLFRLAAPLLSARRRLCQDLQGADGRDRLGRLRHRQLREMRRLHGA